jgi:hypothetical protein
MELGPQLPEPSLSRARPDGPSRLGVPVSLESQRQPTVVSRISDHATICMKETDSGATVIYSTE